MLNWAGYIYKLMIIFKEQMKLNVLDVVIGVSVLGLIIVIIMTAMYVTPEQFT